MNQILKNILSTCNIIIGLASAVVGILLGMLAGQFYSYNNNIWLREISWGLNQARFEAGLGGMLGGILGLLAGLAYMLILCQFLKKDISRNMFILRAVLLGMATGFICSTLLHSVLFLLAGKGSFENEISSWFTSIGAIGIIFAVPPGALLGWIAAINLWNEFKLTPNSEIPITKIPDQEK